MKPVKFKATPQKDKNASSTRRGKDSANFSVLDLFAGAGGLSEGFRQAGFKIIGGSDNDPDAAETYSRNFPEAQTVVGDIRARDVKNQILSLARSASVIIGGPPCQAFSQVRNHSRIIDDPRNSLYREFVHVVGDALPKVFLMENVTGMDQMGVREQIVNDLSLDGEYLVQPQVLDAADFGVPQTRKRLLFAGIHKSLGMSPPLLQGSGATSSISLARRLGANRNKYEVVAEENLFSTGVFDSLKNPNDLSVVSAFDAISDLEGLETGSRMDVISYEDLPEPRSAYQREMRARAPDFLSNVQVPRMNEDTVLRLKGIPKGGNHRDLKEELLERYITGKKWGQDNGTGQLSRKHFYAYRRLHPDIWAWTLNTKADSVYHYSRPRALSVREFARIQSFPDRFVFTTDPRKGPLPGRHDGGAAHSRYRQVGNAVPPLLARAVARELIALLAELPAERRRRRSGTNDAEILV